METTESTESTATYNDVLLACSLRRGAEQIRSLLTLAIECEEAAYSESHKQWQIEFEKVQLEIKEIETFNTQNPASEKPLPALPIEPVIDLSARRACYFVEIEDVDHELSEKNAPQTVKYDDENFIKRIRPAIKARTPEQISETKRRRKKLAAFTFNDVDCSICEADQNGIETVHGRYKELMEQGVEFKPFPFFLENGKHVVMATEQEWLDFREQFWQAREAYMFAKAGM